jgi:quercetin dioxygenase-like cupin family protein
MERRTFMHSAVSLAAAQVSIAPAQTTGRASPVQVGEDRFGESSSPNDCKVSGKDTQGALAVFESTSTRKGGPPLHVHSAQDEWFYVVSGEFAFKVGGQQFRLKAGDSLLAPREIPHTFAHLGDGEGKLLCTFQPAGDMEAFFRALAQLQERTPEKMQALFKAHGMAVVGPPLPSV